MSTAAVKDDRADWLAERRSGLGGSDIADALSEGYGCARRLVYDKQGKPQDYPDEHALIYQRGAALEDLIVERYVTETGRKVRRRATAVHPAYPWARVNVDREILGVPDKPGVGVLEAKSHNTHIFRRVLRDGLPASHILQLQWACFITGRQWGSYAVLCPDTWAFAKFDVDYDAALIEVILPRLEAVWKACEFGPLPPALDPKDKRCARCAWRRTCHGGDLIALAGDDTKEPLPRDDSLRELLIDRAEAKRYAEEAGETLEAIDTRLKAAIGERPGVECDGFRVHYRQQVSERVDTKMLKAKYPDTATACIKPVVSRPLRVYAV